MSISRAFVENKATVLPIICRRGKQNEKMKRD